MKEILEINHIIKREECEPDKIMRISSLMQLFQDAAEEHSDILGFHRNILYKNYGAIWMLGRIWIKLYRPLLEGETLLIRTWPRTVGNGATVYRDFDLIINDELCGEAVTAWVVTNFATRTILRPSSVKEVTEASVPDRSIMKDKVLGKIKSPAEMNILMDREITSQDIDINGHMNNVRYADIISEALKKESSCEHWISEIQINYSAECLCGERIAVVAGKSNGMEIIKGLDSRGKSRFEAAVRVEDL